MNVWEKIKRLNALADTGLLYSANPYDRERYEEIKELSLQLMQEYTGGDAESFRNLFEHPKDYPTAKVDIRALILSDDNKKVLLVQEALDGKWSIPGGWADIGYSPRETVVKECQEETGLQVDPVRLLAVWDKKMHPHPPQAFYVYKLIFLCAVTGGQLQKGFDVLDINWFPLDELPMMSEDRILAQQIRKLAAHAIAGATHTLVD
ncbi:NUDIX hydrolase [Flavihumibacter petaseus]|uniref:Putative ADP-ribose pyrophosphatase n=1 Tax=Flavihumibacter petaseus NBRC 106054 TaxID=1220578 RepID=A0A0E9MUH5_9BACT|nr:NUDIX hydrolase [Flavihumibacter petaseus]GAO41138.1 putative ADP-ribose pyrophosphatase [Flavihumibacter petaseus NBRC 106054]